MNDTRTHHTRSDVGGTSGTAYDYSFFVWPAEKWTFTQQTYDLFRLLPNRVEMTLTPDEFEAFRSAVNRDGLTLREISRVPHFDPEPIY